VKFAAKAAKQDKMQPTVVPWSWQLLPHIVKMSVGHAQRESVWDVCISTLKWTTMWISQASLRNQLVLICIASKISLWGGYVRCSVQLVLVQLFIWFSLAGWPASQSQVAGNNGASYPIR